MNYAIITAGGKGKRMETVLPKQYLSLEGIPILTRTLQVFDRCYLIDKIILVIAKEDFDFCKKKVVSPYVFNKEIVFVSGGIQRQNSVYNGLLSIASKNNDVLLDDVLSDDVLSDDIVLIHDAVRPFITVKQIFKTIDIAKKMGACILATPAFDTVKGADENYFIEKTYCRDKIWFAQTPQTFKYDLILKAYNYAISKGFVGTDDASIMEFYGQAVKLIKGSRKNIKITVKDDLIFAKAILSSLYI